MKFEKITDTKIKIILDINDIKLHNISTNNFFNNSSSQKLLQIMLSEAEKEIGFKVDDSRLLVEAITNSNQEYIFTITKLIEEKKNIENFSSSFIYKFDNFENFVALCNFLNNLSDLNLNEFSKNISLILYNNTYYLYDTNTENYHILLDYMQHIFSEFGNRVLSPFIEGCLNEYGKTIFETNAIVNTFLFFA